MLAELREALRQLRKAPGITTTAVITLALGIGATTAIFTLVHQVMLKSLPVTKPDELWGIGDKVRGCNWGGYTQGDDGEISRCSPGKPTNTFAPTHPNSPISLRCKPAMRSSASAEPAQAQACSRRSLIFAAS
jgi:hypothetical protein